MKESEVIKTVRLKSGRHVLAKRVDGKICAVAFTERPDAVRQLRDMDDDWVLLQLGLMFYVARRLPEGPRHTHRKQVDPTEDQIEERKAEIRKSWERTSKLYESNESHYLQDKYLAIAHANTFHDLFDDIRKVQREDHDQHCDCPYWEHERRNPEF